MIISIVLYQSRTRWKYKTLPSLAYDLEPELIEFIPDYKYIFENLGEIADEQIQAEICRQLPQD